MPVTSVQPVQAAPAEAVLAAPTEPSMEDILASIRRIIAADQTGLGRVGFVSAARPADANVPGVEPAPPVADVPPPQVITSEGEPEVLEATAVELPLQADASPHLQEEVIAVLPEQSAEAAASIPANEAPEAFVEADVASWPTFGAHRDDGQEGPDNVPSSTEAEHLISHTAGASVSSMFETLASSLLIRDPEMIERMAKEALKPMLRTWLDENLPAMVERLVRAEIERVARGGRVRD